MCRLCRTLALSLLALFVRDTASAQPHVLYSFVGDSGLDWFGLSCAGLGDVDMDGWPDIGIGAIGAKWNGPGSGSAYVYSGQTGQSIYRFDGDAAADQAGSGLTGVGDIDNDGFADFVVGAMGSDLVLPDAGVAKLYSGRTGNVIAIYGGEPGYSALGRSVASFGDTNADGFVDFGIGDELGAVLLGKIHVASGFDGSIIRTVTGVDLGGGMGYTVAGAGDLDADGFDDFLGGAPFIKMGISLALGAVYAFSGKSGAVLHKHAGTKPNQYVGQVITGAGDLNADGHDDVMVGLPFDDTFGSFAGAAVVLSGADFSVLRTQYGLSTDDQTGSAVAGQTDVNLDGEIDYFIASPSKDVSGLGLGSVTCYSGSDATVIFQLVDDMDLPEGLGTSLAVIGDVDFDGVQDIAVGMWASKPSAPPTTPPAPRASTPSAAAR